MVLENIHFFDITLYSINLLSFVLGMMFGATMWRVKAMYYVAGYFIAVAIWYGVKAWLLTSPGVTS